MQNFIELRFLCRYRLFCIISINTLNVIDFNTFAVAILALISLRQMKMTLFIWKPFSTAEFQLPVSISRD